MKDNTTQLNPSSTNSSLRPEAPKIDYVVYRENDIQPVKTFDLVTQVRSQIEELKEMHQRKMFLMREITSIRHR